MRSFRIPFFGNEAGMAGKVSLLWENSSSYLENSSPKAERL
jgi:hypothetical protein